MDIKSTSCLGVRGADEIRKIGHGRPQNLLNFKPYISSSSAVELV
jgi:hypothetical protein